MRTLVSTLSLLFFCTLFGNVTYSQSFEKGNKTINAGIKISIYNVNNTNEVDDDDDDKAGSYTIPLGFEYAITNRLGAGIELGICNYFTGEDSVTRAIAEAGSFDMLLKGNFHWVRSGRADLSSGIGLGFSNFNYKSNDNLDSEFNSTGFYFRLSLVDFKLYLGERIGWNLFMGIPYMNFENGRISDNLGSDFSYPLSFSGFDFGTGLVVKW